MTGWDIQKQLHFGEKIKMKFACFTDQPFTKALRHVATSVAQNKHKKG
jgi:hypothetical protein